MDFNYNQKECLTEMTNNNKKTCQNYNLVPRGKYSPSPIDGKHHFMDKIVAVHFIERKFKISEMSYC